MTELLVRFDTDGTGNIEERAFDVEITVPVQNLYISQMNSIKSYFDNSNPYGSLTPGEIAALVSNMNNISGIINNLNSWSRQRTVDTSGNLPPPDSGAPISEFPTFGTEEYNPYDPDGGGSVGTNDTMDPYMAEQLDLLIRTLRAAGWDPISNTYTLNTGSTDSDVIAFLQEIKTSSGGYSSVYAIDTLIATAIGVAQQARIQGNPATDSQSIQQVVMYDYVRHGNDIIYEQLNNLNIATKANQQSLRYFNAMQQLMNQKDPSRWFPQYDQAFFKPDSSTENTSISDREVGTFENSSFNQEIPPNAYFTGNDFDVTSLTDYKWLLGNLALLETGGDPTTDVETDPALYITRIISNLNVLITIIEDAGATSDNQVITSLNTLITDLEGVTTLEQWVEDFTAPKKGDNQRHVTDAVTAAQSINDSNQQEIKRTMFIFEEFYKSAGTILSQLHQTITKISGAIYR